MEQNAAELKNVTKIFNEALEEKAKIAVNDLSFSVKSGVITGFIGPNGAGKTTSIKMILGLVKPTKGGVSLMGIPSNAPRARQNVSFVSEQPYFYEHLTAYETLKFICDLKRVPKNCIDKEILRVLEIVEMWQNAKRRVKSFSKGMQQRLNMAQALIGNPKLIIMDEPMSGMDPLGRRLFRDIFKTLSDQGTTIFFSTHIVEDIEALCDEIIVLSDGKLHLQGSVDDLVNSTTLGVEYRFENLNANVLDFLQKSVKNANISDKKENFYSFILKDKDDLQNFNLSICQNKIMPSSIVPIRSSLEEILYSSHTKGEK
ncbi:MAG: ABC transporter ATP-binding protein [Chitinispirillales bacterium]|jgi:ABC-2 type transport system ATP-binding protein|nr:ABC transporter ATP-binding protein [Chitinispirillales bacterium]